MVVLLSASDINLLTAELEVRLLRKLRLRWVLATLDGEPSLGGLHEDQVIPTPEDKFSHIYSFSSILFLLTSADRNGSFLCSFGRNCRVHCWWRRTHPSYQDSRSTSPPPCPTTRPWWRRSPAAPCAPPRTATPRSADWARGLTSFLLTFLVLLRHYSHVCAYMFRKFEYSVKAEMSTI